MRKSADRRRVHHGSRTPLSVSTAMAAIDATSGNGYAESFSEADYSSNGNEGPAALAVAELDDFDGGLAVTGDGPMVVRRKTHRASPMSLDQALYEMELVGHDFYLYVDAETSDPCVVYRRHGYDYGVIRLET